MSQSLLNLACGYFSKNDYIFRNEQCWCFNLYIFDHKNLWLKLIHNQAVFIYALALCWFEIQKSNNVTNNVVKVVTEIMLLLQPS